MATTQVSTNVKFFIGPVAADTVDSVAEFEALSYTEIGKLLDVGNLVDQSSEITVDYIDTGRTEVYKGVKRAQSLNLQCGYDEDDAGQAAVIAAESSSSNYAFLIQLNNEGSSGSPTNPTLWFFRGQVMSQGVGGVRPNTPITFEANIAVNSARYTKAAN